MEEVNKKYKKILNDLLNITKNDSCIFSNVNNKTIFDVQKKFSDSLFNKIISEKDFNLKKKKKMMYLLKKLNMS